MAEVLVLAEHFDGQVGRRTVELLSALVRLGCPVTLLSGETADARDIAARVARQTGSAQTADVVAVVVDRAARVPGREGRIACAAGYPLPGELDESAPGSSGWRPSER